MIGGAGRDRIYGGDGDDRLYGGRGNDTLTGGKGSDRFIYSAPLLSDATDTITDFNPSEHILQLSAGLNQLPFIGPNVQFVQKGTNTEVQIDPDGIFGSAGYSTLALLNNVNATDLAIGQNVVITTRNPCNTKWV